jgi:hypothetical protein
MMVTMPGLPMFGHGQIEGYAEKYGMEFQRAYWEEEPDLYLVDRHDREIFPLLRKRYLFADVGEFSLYDFFSANGNVNEDVFAYSNRHREERALVVYHNRFAEVRGWIQSSAAYSVKTDSGDQRQLVSRNLGQGLALNPDQDHFTIFRDQVTGQEYIRSNKQIHEQGLYLELGAYKYHVFMDFRQVVDNQWGQYAQLTDYLDGRGVPSIDETLKEIILQPVHFPFLELTAPDMLKRTLTYRRKTGQNGGSDLLIEIEQKASHLLSEINKLTKAGRDIEDLTLIAADTRRKVQAILELPDWIETSARHPRRYVKAAAKLIRNDLGLKDLNQANWYVLLGWAYTHNLGRVMGEEEAIERSRSWIDEWLLGRIFARSLQDLELTESEALNSVGIIKILVRRQTWFESIPLNNQSAYTLLRSLLEEEDVRQFLQINRYQNVLWFNKEAFEQLLGWLVAISVISLNSDPDMGITQLDDEIVNQYRVLQQLKKAQSKSDYQLEKLLEATKD